MTATRPPIGWLPAVAGHQMKFMGLVLLAVMGWLPGLASGAGITWPSNQLLPTFSQPTPVIDTIDVSSASGPEYDLFA